MPWHVARSSECPDDKPWACIKDDDGSIEGCHETEAAAQEQMRALYAAEERSEPEDAGYMDYLGPRLRAMFPDDETDLGIRSEDDGSATMYGYLAVFDSPGKVDSAVEG